MLSQEHRTYPIVNDTTKSHTEIDQPGTASGTKWCIQGESGVTHSGVHWTSEFHTETSVEKGVRQALYRMYLAETLLGLVVFLLFFSVVFVIYRQITYVDPVQPDYSQLAEDSDSYWTNRITVDMTTAQQSAGTKEQRYNRLRVFTYRTIDKAMTIADSYDRARAVTDIAKTLAQHDIDFVLDNHLQKLGDTNMIVSLRARTLVSQALMYLRLERTPAAQMAMLRYNRLVIEFDLKLNLPVNEESFFGAVAVLYCLNDREGLNELFTRQKTSTAVLGRDQQAKCFRLIAGEQVRTGMVLDALETAKRIDNPIELARAWTLILQYAGRPIPASSAEPTMLDLLENPQAVPLLYVAPVEQATDAIFQYLAQQNVSFQTSLLRQIAGSRLMCDVELYKIFRNRLAGSEMINDRIKRQILKILDDPESPTIRAARGMPPLADTDVPRADSAIDNWKTTDEDIHVDVVGIESTPLRTRADQQWLQALLAIAQGYQSVKRFQDADRILKQAFVAAQRFTDPTMRIQFLLSIGELQLAVGSIADARQTFISVASSGLNKDQGGELVRLLVIGRLLDDAYRVASSIESPDIRENICPLLLQEQIRINRLDSAEKTLALMPQGKAATIECRSRLNIAKETAAREDFNSFGLSIPEGNDANWERYCLGLIQQGFLHIANQAVSGISDMQKRINVQTRIAHEYLLLYQAYNDTNDADRSIRQDIQREIVSAANRTEMPVLQTAILQELLTYLAGHLKTEADRADGKQIWTQAIDSCRKIAQPDNEVVLFAQLIVAKNLLETPNLQKQSMPLFTRETSPAAFDETNQLIDECLSLMNSLKLETLQGQAGGHLALALIQIDRTKAAQTILDRTLEIASGVSDHRALTSMLLSTIPALKAMNSAGTISRIYRLAIDAVAHEFSGRPSDVDVYDWRMRDSEIELIVRSQIENGFVDEAVESANRLNEPMLRERLLRTAAYIYLDQGNVDRADLIVQQLTVKVIQSNAIQIVQTLKRRSEFRSLMQEP